jgi:hypothetical protein
MSKPSRPSAPQRPCLQPVPLPVAPFLNPLLPRNMFLLFMVNLTWPILPVMKLTSILSDSQLGCSCIITVPNLSLGLIASLPWTAMVPVSVSVIVRFLFQLLTIFYVFILISAPPEAGCDPDPRSTLARSTFHPPMSLQSTLYDDYRPSSTDDIPSLCDPTPSTASSSSSSSCVTEIITPDSVPSHSTSKLLSFPPFSSVYFTS